MFDSQWVFVTIAGFVGLLLGSFANVLILRVPEGKNFVSDRSRCRSCNQVVAWFDNIPVLSYFILRGKCRKCGSKFSPRYPLVEALTGGLFAITVYFFGLSWTTLELLIFFYGLIVITFIDLDHFLIPDIFSLPGIAIGLLGAALNPERAFFDAFVGCFLGGGFLWSIAVLYEKLRKVEGMGGGDIKLLAWIGAVLGWSSLPFVILSSSLIGGIVGILMMRKSADVMKSVIPFGPFLALGSVLYVFWGSELMNQYFRLFFE